MSSMKKRLYMVLTVAAALNISGISAVYAGNPGVAFTDGETLTHTRMNQLNDAVTDNDTRTTANTTHRTSDGKDHSDVLLNNTHRTSDGKNHSDVVANTTAIGTLNTTTGTHTTDIANLKGNLTGGTCVGNGGGDTMVRVGSVCVDKYEAFISGGVARSVAADTPSSGVTWIAAANACAAAGKRLPTNAEWQVAATGTTAASCNSQANGSNTGTVAPSNTFQACVSTYLVANMIGNAAEWVADWQNVATDGDALEASNVEGDFGILRGGDTSDTGSVGWLSTGASLGDTLAPGGGGLGIGFRCVR